MKKEMIIRAWKDPRFRERLTAEQRTQLPESPAGWSMLELDEKALGGVAGGYFSLSGPACGGDWGPTRD